MTVTAVNNLGAGAEIESHQPHIHTGQFAGELT